MAYLRDDENDPFYDLHAQADYRREAYGDPCRACGTLTWGGDCPNCEAEAESRDADPWSGWSTAERQAFLDRVAVDPTDREIFIQPDEIPF